MSTTYGINHSRINGTNGTGFHCLIRDDLFEHFSLIPALVIITILSWLEGRSQKGPGVKCRFSLPVPVDFFDTHSNRWSYAVAFGATTTACISLFTDAYSSNYLPYLHDWPLWSQLLITILSVLELGVNYYPFFACMSYKVKFVGAVMGFLYSATWFSVKAVFAINCAGPMGQDAFQFLREDGDIFNVITRLPTVVCLFLLVAKFALMIEGSIEEHVRRKREPPPQRQSHTTSHKRLVHDHHLLHVRRLLRKPQETPQLPWYRKIWYKPDPAFRFSARVITTVVVTFLCLYEIMVIDLFFGKVLWTDAKHMVNFTINYTIAVDIDGEFWDVVKSSWTVTGIVTGFILFLYLLRILACYRKHMKLLYTGDYSWMPKTEISSSIHVFQSLKYSGAQIAYMMWGYFIVQVILMAVIVIIYILSKNSELVLASLQASLPPTGISIVVVSAQWLLAKYVFLQRPEDGEQPLAFQHFKAYHIFAYFLFFFNIIVGFISCFSRVITSLVVGSLLLSRIDRTVLMEGFEMGDVGYLFYISMVRIEVAHTHPVLLSFCQLLLDTNASKKRNSTYRSYGIDQKPLFGSKPLWRWHLAYTLLRNPDLKKMRKGLLKRGAAELIRPLDRNLDSDNDIEADDTTSLMRGNGEVLSVNMDQSDVTCIVSERAPTEEEDIKLLSL